MARATPRSRQGEITERNFNPWLDAADIVRVVLSLPRRAPDLRAIPRRDGGRELRRPPHRGRAAPPPTPIATRPAPPFTSTPRSRRRSARTSPPPARPRRSKSIAPCSPATAPHEPGAAGRRPACRSRPRPADLRPRSEQRIHPLQGQEHPVSFLPNVVEHHAARPRHLRRAQARGRRVRSLRRARRAPRGSPVLGQVLGQDPDGIAKLRAGERGDAYRLVDPDRQRSPSTPCSAISRPTIATSRWSSSIPIGAPFVSSTLVSLGLQAHEQPLRPALPGGPPRRARLHHERRLRRGDSDPLPPRRPRDVHLGRLLVYTRATRPSPSISAPGAFDAPAGTSRTVTFPTYAASGHSIALDEPELADDIAASPPRASE